MPHKTSEEIENMMPRLAHLEGTSKLFVLFCSKVGLLKACMVWQMHTGHVLAHEMLRPLCSQYDIKMPAVHHAKSKMIGEFYHTTSTKILFYLVDLKYEYSITFESICRGLIHCKK
jgi:hypothetical protein